MDSTTFSQSILGGYTIPHVVALLVFAMAGVLISLLIHSTNRDKGSPNTPVKFSLWFLLKDNWKRILLNLLLIVVTIRFCQEITGLQVTEFIALLIGVSYDKLSEFLQNKQVLIGKKDDSNYVK